MAKRNRYFSGQLMTARDFEDEQEYWLNKLRQHNRYLHGYGVAAGLEVALQGGMVTVQPGAAVDGEGNLIEVLSPQSASLPDLGKELYVCLAYKETLVDFVPALYGEDSPANPVEASRIMDDFELSFADSDPCHACSSTGIGCGVRHPVPIARLRRVRSGWRVDSRYFAPACN
jgi:hypothetical protein